MHTQCSVFKRLDNIDWKIFFAWDAGELLPISIDKMLGGGGFYSCHVDVWNLRMFIIGFEVWVILGTEVHTTGLLTTYVPIKTAYGLQDLYRLPAGNFIYGSSKW